MKKRTQHHTMKRIYGMVPVIPMIKQLTQMQEIAKRYGLEIYEDPKGGLYLVTSVHEWVNRPSGIAGLAAYSGFDLSVVIISEETLAELSPEEKSILDGDDKIIGYEAMIWGMIPSDQMVCFHEIKAYLEKVLEMTITVDQF